MRRLPAIFLLALLVLIPLRAGHALESAGVRTSRTVATLVSETDSVSPGETVRLGLHLRLAPGWHTYWQNPGEAGVAPQLSLDLPHGAQAGPIEWSAPQRFDEGQVTTYAYAGDVLLPLTVSNAQPGEVRAHASWLVCKDICVPEEGDFQLTIPAGRGGPGKDAHAFATHDRTVPRPSPWLAEIAQDGSLWVQGPELTPTAVVDAWFIPSRPGEIQDGAAQLLSVRDRGFVLALKLAKNFDRSGGLEGIVTVQDRTGLQTSVTLHAAPGTAPAAAIPRLGRALLFAFLGGLILNLMPCVFPILAMKAVSVVQGTARREVRAHAIFYAAGVLVMFSGLGTALLLARTAGHAAGWGFQFASPAAVAAMAWLLFAVGLNLSGVFEAGSGFAGLGSALAARSGHAGSFFTGLLAVLVATPCTAPFMSVAIAAALAAPASVTILVFLVMGTGLAAPYLLLAVVPGLARLAPAPGPWMNILKQGLAFPMYGAAAWLLWVITQEAGASGVLATAAGFVLIGFGAWVLGISQRATDHARRFGQAVAAATVLAALAILTGIAEAPLAGARAEASGAEVFSPERLASLRADGRPVFVNMTAAWCVTCLVNERVALESAAVQQAFADRQVVYLKGDWTRQDPGITAYLRDNGRDGVPLYVYYPPHGSPSVLPQVLTENTVLSELDRS